MSALSAPVLSHRTSKYFPADFAQHRQEFESRPFVFEHCLTDHPLFQLPRLVSLALSRPSDDFYFDQGDAHPGKRWREMPPRKLTVVEAIERIQDSAAWIVLNHAEKDPEYNALLDEALDEILAAAPFKSDFKSREVIVFITSPGRVTPYHIDRECNFLLQISGKKTVYIYDRNDREILPEHEIEDFWSRDNNAPVYRPQFQDRAQVIELKPGMGVHIPVNCPHWVQNGDGISVSVSINFQFHDWRRQNIYRANHALRKLGITPTPPGNSAWKDWVKGYGLTLPIECRRLIRRIAK